MKTSPSMPYVFWLYGRSGAGKSTLAGILYGNLREHGLPVVALDGDELRGGLSPDLGFSAEDRTENIRRAAHVAKLICKSGVSVVVSMITPLQSQRDMVGEILNLQNLSMIHISATEYTCRERDTKGLYAGNAIQMFDPPVISDLTLCTDAESVEDTAVRLVDFSLRRITSMYDVEI